jgi:multiple sugar transport system ATP-binding protein
VPRVVLEHLTKTFEGPKGERIRAVEDLSLSVEDKELLVLAGPSGCGKTTTLRLIAGLDEPDGGNISIDGQSMKGVLPKQRDIAMVFQNPALYPHMSVYENMAFGLKLRKLPRAEIERRVGDAAELLGLGACLGRKPAELSGGQRQRVALGRAIVRRPKVFLFDEPLSNLDAQLRMQMRAEISKLHTRLAATMIYVTHDQVEAMTLGQRIAVMKDGAIQQVAEPLHLYEHPASRFVAGFIPPPPMNFFEGTLGQGGKDRLFQAGQGETAGPRNCFEVRLASETIAALKDYVGKPIVLGIRPEHIGVNPREDTPAEQTVSAVVESIEPLGAETHLHLVSGPHLFVARVQWTAPLKVGQRVAAVIEMQAAHWFDPVSGRALI